MTDPNGANGLEEIGEADDLGELDGEQPLEHPLLGTPEHDLWGSSYLAPQLPSLLLDPSLRVAAANDGFCGLYGCEAHVSGQYFTRFFSLSFDAARSAELFRSVLSEKEGFRWSGQVEKTGPQQRTVISKVLILPLYPRGPSAGPAAEGRPGPRAYSAVCVDISVEYRGLIQSTFASLLEAARQKDNDTGNHIERVNRYATVLAESLAGMPGYAEVSGHFIESIGQVAALHDVGKIGTPDDILNKAGPLEAWERDVMQEHAKNGAYILSKYPNPMAKEIALRHHEKWDGSGYPYGIAGEMIPLSARIVALSDVYDALRMRRSYKEAFSHEKAVEIMKKSSGTHFDPVLFERFLGVADRFNGIFGELADTT
jgi:hypothetical protein